MTDSVRVIPGMRVVAGEVRRATREAQRIIDDATAKSEKIVSNAMGEAESIKHQAEQRGLCESYRKATLILAAANEYRYHQERILEAELIDLSIAVARQVICDELSLRPELITRRIRTGLLELTEVRKIEVRLNASDFKTVHLQELDAGIINQSSLSLVMDEKLKPGDCIIVTPIMKIDMRVDQVIALLRDDLRRMSEMKGEINDKS